MGTEAKVIFGIGGLVVAALVVAVFLFSSASSTPPTNTQINTSLLLRANSHILNTSPTASSSAKVTVIEFGDYQCPACEAAYPITQEIIQNYSGKINFVFRNYPLPQHQFAQLAAEAAEAAGAQGKFWPYHDKLYDTQNTWVNTQDPLPLFIQYASQLGLNTQQFQQAVTSNKFASEINQDISDGNSLGINATPTFFIAQQQGKSLTNATQVVGVPTYNQLSSTIDQKLK